MQKTQKFKDFLKTSRPHRKENYWDVCFDESIEPFENAVLSEFIGRRNNRLDVQNRNISIERTDLTDVGRNPGENLVIRNVHFERCDFSGNNGGVKISIENCKFHKCYFSFSEFNDVSFKDCEFESCSFAQSKFFRCIFDANCVFYRISISGSTIIFKNTEVNAVKFLDNIYKPFKENKKIYKEKEKKDYEEQYLLSKSIVKLSRMILKSNQSSSNDELYYAAVKNLYLKKIEEKKAYNTKMLNDSINNIKNKKQERESRKNKETLYILRRFFRVCCFFVKNIFIPIEKKLIELFGFVNGWGGSLQRVFFIGFLILLLYYIIYIFMGQGYVELMGRDGNIEKIHAEGFYYYTSTLIKSFDITFLAGYTKHVSNHDGLFKQLVLLSNMLMGLFWYAVAIPSLINKISINRL